jgi:hypothetical protein
MKTTSTILRAIPAGLLFALAGTASAQCGGVISTLLAPDRQASDYFGISLALSGTVNGIGLMVGAPGNDTPSGSNAGGVYSIPSPASTTPGATSPRSPTRPPRPATPSAALCATPTPT